jgi:hypothetical protein
MAHTSSALGPSLDLFCCSQGIVTSSQGAKQNSLRADAAKKLSDLLQQRGAREMGQMMLKNKESGANH